ncbi:Uncharacterized protein DAT39_006037, partial [Clarias magur]
IPKCKSHQHERRLEFRTETLTLSELQTHPSGNHSQDSKKKIPGSCYLCKKVVEALQNYVREQLNR